MLEPGKLHDLNIKIPILKYQTVGSSDFVNDLKFPIEKLRESVEMFHKASQAIRRRGVYQLKDLANMDQTPLPFVLDDGKTYDKTGVDEVWCASGASGLDKRQCTVQLTIFADGGTLMPLIIFRGQGMRINAAEKKAWDKRVKVMFQTNAWCDEAIMKKWINDVVQHFF